VRGIIGSAIEGSGQDRNGVAVKDRSKWYTAQYRGRFHLQAFLNTTATMRTMKAYWRVEVRLHRF